jgi:hypothetical protein
MSKGGPASREGKDVVRWNATRHGISSPAPVVPGMESDADWQRHREGILENLAPVGTLEVALAERVALCAWRLHRVARYETEAIFLSQEAVEGDLHDRRRLLNAFRGGGSPYATTHPVDVRFEAKDTRDAHRALKRFASSQRGTDRTLRGTDASAIVFGAYMAARKATGAEFELEDLDLPGVPEDAFVYELPAMCANDVWGCVKAVAATASLEPEEVLERAIEDAAQDVRSAAIRLEDTEGEILRMRRERVLPDHGTLEKVARYEAHLSRQMYQALHEFENLQKHRKTGEGTPLARIDVQGLADT